MNLFEQFFEAFFVLSIIVDEYLYLLVSTRLPSCYSFYFVWVLWSFGNIDWNKRLYFFKVRRFSVSQLLIDTHWFGLVDLLVNNDRSLQDERLPGVFCSGGLGIVRANFNLNGIAVMFAYLSRLSIRLLMLSIPGYLEIPIFSLERMHDFRWLFAEWHGI